MTAAIEESRVIYTALYRKRSFFGLFPLADSIYLCSFIALANSAMLIFLGALDFYLWSRSRVTNAGRPITDATVPRIASILWHAWAVMVYWMGVEQGSNAASAEPCCTAKLATVVVFFAAHLGMFATGLLSPFIITERVNNARVFKSLTLVAVFGGLYALGCMAVQLKLMQLRKELSGEGPAEQQSLLRTAESIAESSERDPQPPSTSKNNNANGKESPENAV